MPRRLPPLLALLALALAALPAAAFARPGQQVTFEAPRELVYTPALRDDAFATLGSLGVRSLRIVLYWKNVAPASRSRVKPAFDATDPASYAWGGYDAAIDGAAQRGWKVLLTISGPVPRWATNGAKDTLTYPRTREFQAFATAVARHYAGRVEAYSIWNEPNQPQFLLPQYDARHRPVSPRVYRGLLLAAIRGLRAGGAGEVPVLMGETSPQGTGKVVAPLTFLRGALCLNAAYRPTRRCARLPVAGYAHHAYTTKAGPFYVPPSPNSVTIGVLGRLVRALDRAARAGAIPRRLPIWLTEFGIQSVPDVSYGVSLATQNEYRAIAERIAWDSPRVAAFSQYLLRDDLPLRGRRGAARYGGFESGLRTAAGRDKPALAGFRLPLAARRRGARVALWGLVRPAGGPTRVVLQAADRGRAFRRVADVATGATGAWRRTAAYRAGRRYRVVWTAPDGRRFTSPPVRAYR
ncbi:MAG TPA: hypothetical protein VLB47_00400 [Solirubrobacteraceae bacterium]|nr:hypothetical protein [Solirubrobacteraceae bacterium]